MAEISQKTARLQIENRKPRQIRQAWLNLCIETEAWAMSGRSFFGKPKYGWLYGPEHARAFWNIEIVVDDKSGEDCEPAPVLRLPINGKAFPTRLEDICGIRLEEDDTRGAEAWFGNDAPALERNVLEFGEWLDDGRLLLRWSAEYDWGIRQPERIPFLFEGPVAFSGITMAVKKDEDAPVFLAQVLPALDPSGLTRECGFVVDPGVAAEWKIEPRLPRKASWTFQQRDTDSRSAP